MRISLSRRQLIIPAVAAGILCLVVLIKTARKPERVEVAERTTTVRVMKAPQLAVIPRVIGYGHIQAGQEWQAVTEVSGQIVEINPYFKKGALLAKGDMLVRIDPAKRLTARQASTADVNNLLAQLRELEQTERDTKHSYEVEKKSLDLYRKEYERMKHLMASGTIARSEMESTERQLLTQENKVQSYRTTLNGIPAQRQALLASISASRSRLEEAEIDLAKTYIRAPFDCRITEVSVEKGQAVNSGQTIAKADSIGLSEAVAQMPMYMFRYVVPRGGNPIAQGEKLTTETFQRFLSLDALVRIELGSDTVSWKGRVTRMNDSIDPNTRTVGVYVAVDDSYIKAEPGKRPPLLPNMFCEVELRGHPIDPAVAIPRSALHGDTVYVMNADNRLELRKVTVDFPQGHIVVLRSGLAEGETIVLTDVIPAMENMLLNPVTDEQAIETITREALGEGSVR
ncbi:biotin/lipoyl-binding protein [Desulfovibrio mangrovi]|uniref:efflux RND transporter periplasmic adaptor subunit n=1 Tax=Desulfovibrio mangrovi TaxID=2976983 RepID=UPI0022470CD3|nr:biotin/lipoyl-binding protein [Desulfovibrio mangrovi]UZP67253.1 biotin/lipoyl-binding protein [Desulfovibrio mangrovi]